MYAAAEAKIVILSKKQNAKVACLSDLLRATKKSKPRFFSKEYFHHRQMEKSGEKIPQFGSYKYTAVELHKKGVLVSIKDYSPKQ
jgi:hypothetical protein